MTDIDSALGLDHPELGRQFNIMTEEEEFQAAI
jgi:hypothetical protein